VGGNSARPSRSEPAGPARKEQSPQKVSFPFPFRRKNRARAIKNEKKTFLRTASEASGGGASVQNSIGFSSKKVRISSNKHHQIAAEKSKPAG
jgi:hypothetical protein